MIFSLFAKLAVLYLYNWADAKDVEVTCGSIVKLKHVNSGYRLHSHQIKWGGGSGQQSVTANAASDDQGELFLVKEQHNAMPCEAGAEIKCGSTVRLEHVHTHKNIHTHDFKSPLTRLQEVSAFGEEGYGDAGDNWIVQCVDQKISNWTKDSKVFLYSPETKMYLHSSATARFNQSNCPHCPIIGQQEVSAQHARNDNSHWVAEQGLFLSSS